MIKEHQKCYMYVTYQRPFLKQLLKETFESTRENPSIEKNCILFIKLLTLLNWSHRMEKVIAAVKIFLLTWLR